MECVRRRRVKETRLGGRGACPSPQLDGQQPGSFPSWPVTCAARKPEPLSVLSGLVDTSSPLYRNAVGRCRWSAREGRRRHSSKVSQRPGPTPPRVRRPRGARCNGSALPSGHPGSLSSLLFLLLTLPFPTRTVWPVSGRFLQSHVCPFIIERGPCFPRDLCSALVKTGLSFHPLKDGHQQLCRMIHGVSTGARTRIHQKRPSCAPAVGTVAGAARGSPARPAEFFQRQPLGPGGAARSDTGVTAPGCRVPRGARPSPSASDRFRLTRTQRWFSDMSPDPADGGSGQSRISGLSVAFPLAPPFCCWPWGSGISFH